MCILYTIFIHINFQFRFLTHLESNASGWSARRMPSMSSAVPILHYKNFTYTLPCVSFFSSFQKCSTFVVFVIVCCYSNRIGTCIRAYSIHMTHECMNAWSLQYEKCFTFWNFTCNNSHSQLTQSVYIFCRSLGVCFSKRIFSLLQIQFSLSFLMFSFVPNAIHCRCGLYCRRRICDQCRSLIEFMAICVMSDVL